MDQKDSNIHDIRPEESLSSGSFTRGIFPSSKKELAVRYFPFLTVQSAVNKLMNFITLDKQLMSELLATGMTKYQKHFTSKQVSLIYHYLGTPPE